MPKRKSRIGPSTRGEKDYVVIEKMKRVPIAKSLMLANEFVKKNVGHVLLYSKQNELPSVKIILYNNKSLIHHTILGDIKKCLYLSIGKNSYYNVKY